MFRKKIILGIFAVFACNFVWAQQADSSRTRISLLTCSPGSELYSVFGHSALRVVDSNAVTDIVYNYGTFDFNDPNFYSKFVRGKLNYYLSTEYFRDFVYGYRLEGRGITEQVLLLTAEEKLALKKFLRENLKPENRHYAYDFFLDNCTTRLRDLIIGMASAKPQLPYVMPEDYSFRNAIHAYLDSQQQDWNKLGIDLLLGAPTDAIMSAEQQQFLPDNLMYALDKAEPGIVQQKQILQNSTHTPSSGFRLTPIMVFSLLAVLFILLQLTDNRFAKRLIRSLDFLLFFITGVLGILFVFMWVGTDHSMTVKNYNLLWAIPTNACMAFFIGAKAKWVKKYFLIISIITLLCLLSWAFLPQQLNIGLIPLVFVLTYRSLMLYKS